VLALVAIVVVMFASGVSPSTADTVGTPDPVVRAKLGAGNSPAASIVPPGPLNMVGGVTVHIHVDAGSGSTIGGVNVRLCKPGLDITETTAFFPTQGGNCIPSSFVANRDDSFKTQASAPPNTSVDVDFKVGRGTKTFTWDGGAQTSTVTCNAQNPCALWVDAVVPPEATSDGTGHVWKHFDITYRNTAVADFNANSTTDVAVFRPSTGEWLDQSQPPVTFGLSGDLPVPCDYNGDGSADIAVFRPSTGVWFVSGQSPVSFGLTGDIPAPGDYNGDGTCDVAVFRPSTGAWFIQGQSTVFLGVSGDLPMPGDYDGNGTTDVAVWRPVCGCWFVTGQSVVYFGLPGDVPVPGDFDGNGTTDIAVYRPSVGGWYRNGAATTFFGATDTVPVPGDYDGNGTTDIVVFRPSDGAWFVNGGAATLLGAPGDIVLQLSPGSRAALS